jgi:hypothetical protein
MPEAPTITDADILYHVVSPDRGDLDPAAARAVLNLHFDETATERIRVLLRRNQEGALSGQEQDELQKYLRVGQFLDLLHAKAHLALQS